MFQVEIIIRLQLSFKRDLLNHLFLSYSFLTLPEKLEINKYQSIVETYRQFIAHVTLVVNQLEYVRFIKRVNQSHNYQ